MCILLKEMSPAERNYDFDDQELLAVKLALGGGRQGAIPYPHRQTEPGVPMNSQAAEHTWWAFTRFHITLSYRPGYKNIKADALSHNHNLEEVPIQSAPIILPSDIFAPVLWDIDMDIHQALEREPAPATCPPERIYVPMELRHHWTPRYPLHYAITLR